MSQYRYAVFVGICCYAAFAIADDVTECPPASTPAVEQLHRTADQLDTAGQTEEAITLRAAAEAIRQQLRRERVDVDRQIQALQQRSALLRRLSGEPPKLEFRVHLLELSHAAAVDFANAATLVPSKTTPSLPANPDSGDHIATTELRENFGLPVWVYHDAEAAFQRLKESGAVTILAAPKLIVDSQQQATLTPDSEFPIRIPDANGQTQVIWQRFGLACELRPRQITPGTIQLACKVEYSQRDDHHSITFHDHRIPSLHTSFVSAQAELPLGDSLLIPLGHPPTTPKAARDLLSFADAVAPNPTDRITLFLVTPVASD